VHDVRHNTTPAASHLAAASAAAAFCAWCLAACAPNEPPAFASPGDRVLSAGQRLELLLEASDPEGGVVAFGARGLPPGSRLAPVADGARQGGGQAARFTWVPLPSDGAAEGRSHPVTFIAQDGEGAQRVAHVTLTVYLDAALPRFTSPPAFARPPGGVLDEVVVVRDDDGPRPTVRLVAGPPGVSLEPHPDGARLRFTVPDEPDPAAPGGLYAIVLEAAPTVWTCHVVVTD
jgi:hypothetical protein